MAYHCVVKECTNGSYRLNKWKYEMCAEHKCRKEDDECHCPPPFTLYPFPTIKKNACKRETWIKLVNRLKPGSKTSLFEPKKDARVCSFHFKEGKPSVIYPNPTENLGYDSKRRVSILSPSPRQSKKRIKTTNSDISARNNGRSAVNDHRKYSTDHPILFPGWSI